MDTGTVHVDGGPKGRREGRDTRGDTELTGAEFHRVRQVGTGVVRQAGLPEVAGQRSPEGDRRDAADAELERVDDPHDGDRDDLGEDEAAEQRDDRQADVDHQGRGGRQSDQRHEGRDHVDEGLEQVREVFDEAVQHLDLLAEDAERHADEHRQEHDLHDVRVLDGRDDVLRNEPDERVPPELDRTRGRVSFREGHDRVGQFPRQEQVRGAEADENGQRGGRHVGPKCLAAEAAGVRQTGQPRNGRDDRAEDHGNDQHAEGIEEHGTDGLEHLVVEGFRTVHAHDVDHDEPQDGAGDQHEERQDHHAVLRFARLDVDDVPAVLPGVVEFLRVGTEDEGPEVVFALGAPVLDLRNGVEVFRRVRQRHADASEPVADPDLHRSLRRLFEEPDGDLLEQQQRGLDVFRVRVVFLQVRFQFLADAAERLERQVIFDDLFLFGHRETSASKLDICQLL